jgi:methylaspartate ammonia-lyase
MRIKDVKCVIARSGWFNKDRVAFARARMDGFVASGEPTLPGYTAPVQPGTAISVIVVTEEGLTGVGDCVDVNLSGFSGRDPLFIAKDHIVFMQGEMRRFLAGKPIDTFRSLAGEVDAYQRDGKRLHTALRYGLSQAILDAVAMTKRATAAQVVAREYGCEMATGPIPILANCQKGNWMQIDRMILKQIDMLPHAGAHTVDEDVGKDGEILHAYVKRVSDRIAKIGAADYNPTIHVDLYGTLGELFQLDLPEIARYMAKLGRAAAPYPLLVETPIIAKTIAEQIAMYAELRRLLHQQEPRVGLIADEWCNTLDDVRAFAKAGACDYAQIKTPDLGGLNDTIEAALACRDAGIGCYVGGSANETDQSSRLTVQVALGCRADFILAKPGLGGDEALMIQSNEMARALAMSA